MYLETLSGFGLLGALNDRRHNFFYSKRLEVPLKRFTLQDTHNMLFKQIHPYPHRVQIHIFRITNTVKKINAGSPRP